MYNDASKFDQQDSQGLPLPHRGGSLIFKGRRFLGLAIVSHWGPGACPGGSYHRELSGPTSSELCEIVRSFNTISKYICLFLNFLITHRWRRWLLGQVRLMLVKLLLLRYPSSTWTPSVHHGLSILWKVTGTFKASKTLVLWSHNAAMSKQRNFLT